MKDKRVSLTVHVFLECSLHFINASIYFRNQKKRKDTTDPYAAFLMKTLCCRHKHADTLSYTERWWFIWTCESASPCGPQLEKAQRPTLQHQRHMWLRLPKPPPPPPPLQTQPNSANLCVLASPSPLPFLLQDVLSSSTQLGFKNGASHLQNCGGTREAALESCRWQSDACLWWVYFYVCTGMWSFA